MRSKSVVWIPVLLVGALVYWTLAFGFGGMSLMAFTMFQDCPDSSEDGSANSVKDSYQSITVNLSELPATDQEQGGRPAGESFGPEPEPSSVSVDLVSDHDVATTDQGGQGAHGGGQRSYQGPGDTAF